MKIQKLWLFLALFAALPLAGCERCEDEGERNFKLLFFQDNLPVRPQFEQVYGLGGTGNLSITQADTVYRLPISLHQDSTTFVLVSDSSQHDTLTIKYKRDFLYQNRSCGFRVKFSDFQTGRSTTFSDVTITDLLWDFGYYSNSPEAVYEIRIYR